MSSRNSILWMKWGGFIKLALLGVAWVSVFAVGPQAARRYWKRCLVGLISHGVIGTDDYFALNHDAVSAAGWFFVVSLIGATGLAFLVATTKWFQQTRFDATGVDRLEPLRRWTFGHPRISTALSYLPAFAAQHAIDPFNEWGNATIVHMVTATLGVLALALVTRVVLRPLVLAPRYTEMKDEPTEELFFRAVAVTPETKAAVWAMAGVATVGVALAYRYPSGTNGNRGIMAIGAVACLSALATLVFMRASRIALGLDGVLVTGTSRTRFYSYAALDKVDISPTGEVLLEQNAGVVVRLQLHGKDAPRRDAIIERIEKGLARARQPMSGGANRLAEASKQTLLDEAARGQATYRGAGANRDEVWEVLEASATLADARIKAAEALKIGCDTADIQRLRIAAERCAEPVARKVILRIVSDLEEVAQEAESEARSEADLAIPNRHLDIKSPDR